MSMRITRWDDATEFWRLYGSLARTLALRRAVTWATRLLLLGFLATLVAVVTWRLLERPLPPLPLLFVPGLLAAGCGFLAGFLRRERPERAVRLADTRLDLKERLTTALELVRGGGAHPLAAVQVADAVLHLSRADLLDAFPIRVPLRAGNLALIAAVLIPIAALAPNPLASTHPADRSHEVAKAEAVKLDQLANQLAQQDQNPRTNQIRQLLQDAAQKLQSDTASPDQQLAALSDLEAQLNQLGAADQQGLDAALAALAASLANTPGQGDLAKRLATGDLQQVSRDLRHLGQDQRGMSAAERAQLARALQEAAQNAARSNQGFARGMQQAASALANSQGADQAQQALNGLADQVGSAASQQQALAQTQASQSNLSRATGQQGAGAQSNSSTQPGSAADQRQAGTGDRQEGGNAPGQASGEQSQPGEGTSPSQNSSPGAGQQGQQPGGSSAGSGDATSQQDQIYDPLYGSHTEQVPNQQPFQPSEVSNDPYLSSPDQNGSQVGYRQVYGQYEKRAVQNIEQSYVPLGMKDLVRQYFNELDPNRSGG